MDVLLKIHKSFAVITLCLFWVWVFVLLITLTYRKVFLGSYPVFIYKKSNCKIDYWVGTINFNNDAEENLELCNLLVKELNEVEEGLMFYETQYF